MNEELLAKENKESEEWEKSLCYEADGESFEKVVMKAAEKLGVDIL